MSRKHKWWLLGNSHNRSCIGVGEQEQVNVAKELLILHICYNSQLNEHIHENISNKKHESWNWREDKPDTNFGLHAWYKSKFKENNRNDEFFI